MKRFMVYLLNDKYNRQDASGLLIRARNLVAESSVILRDIRVATHFLEIDMSISDGFQLAPTLSLLGNIAPLVEYQEIEENKLEKKDSINYAIALFNSEKYWRTHEILEGVWKHSENTEKQILNSIILISAAFVHYQKNEGDICIGILERALQKLGDAEGDYFGMDLSTIKAKVAKIIKTRIVEKLTI